MSITPRVSRRSALKFGAAAAALPLVHIRTAGAAGKLSLGFWDHWVPKTNDVLRKQVQTWAEKNKVETNIDFITSSGGKLMLTAAAEYQARVGHDVLPVSNWDVINFADRMEPVDEVVNSLQKQYGNYSETYNYLGNIKGAWRAVPSSTGSLNLTCVGRISLLKKHAGIDIQKMYPAAPSDKPLGGEWNYEAFLKAAEACSKAGFPFGLGLGSTNDSINNTGSWYQAFGAELIDAKGEIQVDSDKVHNMLEWGQRFVKFLPPDTVSYDDASNNRALISGRSALIMNPPSAWAVAKRDAREIAEDCWSFPMPAGPAGRFIPYSYAFYSIWEFAQNKSAAKELVHFLQERKQVEERDIASEGYDLPPFQSMSDFAIWSEVEPPKGTIYNYPLRPWHDSKPSIAAYPAPPEIAVQVYHRAVHPTMLAKLHSGQSIKQVVDWARGELEGFLR
ncbi:MAG: ABC transporter substrate-binding protein [Acetobacteraceae bacterium]